MIAILRLIRFPNLIIIAATQYLFRYMIMEPVVKISGGGLALSSFEFFLIVLSTTMLAAAGYAINDYFDTRIDSINKPSKVVIGKSISRKKVMLGHLLLNLMAIIIGVWLAVRTGRNQLVFIQPLVAGALWFYSVDLKHRFLAGNILIAGLAFMVPLLPVLYELPLIANAFSQLITGYESNLFYLNQLAIGYAVFAFLTNLIREVVKDMEDMEGDEAFGSKTLPLVVGIKISKWVAGFLITITVGLLSYLLLVPSWQSGDYISFFYFLIFILIPLVFALTLLFSAYAKSDFARISLWLKIVMLGGVFSMVIYRLTL